MFADTVGVALGVNYQNRKFESDNSEVEYGEFDGGSEDELFANSLQHRKYEIERKRIGANLNFDWRPNEDSQYYLRTLYTQFDDAETRQRTIFNFGDGEVTALGNNQFRVDDLPADAIQKRMRYRTRRKTPSPPAGRREPPDQRSAGLQGRLHPHRRTRQRRDGSALRVQRR